MHANFCHCHFIKTDKLCEFSPFRSCRFTPGVAVPAHYRFAIPVANCQGFVVLKKRTDCSSILFNLSVKSANRSLCLFSTLKKWQDLKKHNYKQYYHTACQCKTGSQEYLLIWTFPDFTLLCNLVKLLTIQECNDLAIWLDWISLFFLMASTLNAAHRLTAYRAPKGISPSNPHEDKTG